MRTFPVIPIVTAIVANCILGVSSIYWHLFSDMSPIGLVVYRVLFSLIFLIFAAFLFNEAKSLFEKIKVMRLILIHVVAAILVAINWGTFIWASIHGNVLESGLGYLAAPVVVMIVGLVMPGRTLSASKFLAITIICAALMALVLTSGQLAHWVYWTIALTWGGYTLLKKQTSLTPIQGLLVETVGLFAIFAVPGFFLNFADTSTYGETLVTHPWLWMCGVVSVSPLLMFSFAARELDSFSMGAMQFVLPTTQLLVSILYYNQSISAMVYVCFGVIWISLAITTIVELRRA